MTRTREQVYRDAAPLVRRLVENHRARIAAGAAPRAAGSRPAPLEVGERGNNAGGEAA